MLITNEQVDNIIESLIIGVSYIEDIINDLDDSDTSYNRLLKVYENDLEYVKNTINQFIIEDETNANK